MKKLKTKKRTITRNSSTKNKTILKRVANSHIQTPILRHFKLAHHKHTFRLVHYKNTSHLALFIALLFLGFFLITSFSVVKSYTSNGFVTIGATVNGPPPTIGATITKPKNGERFSNNLIEVSGTCQNDTLVVLKNNNLVAGSANCTEASIFAIDIQLYIGANVLSALNYDNLNQPGPATPSVMVEYIKDSSQNNNEVIKPDIKAPDNPSNIPGIDDKYKQCSDYKFGKMPTGGDTFINIICLPRLFMPNSEQSMGFLIWGGEPPYAVNIDWGDGSNPTLLTFDEPGYKVVNFSYKQPGLYSIIIRSSDKNHNKSTAQSATKVSGDSDKTNPITNIMNDINDVPLFKASVPLYLIAVAATVGFWIGDLFDRKVYFIPKKRKLSRR